MSNPIRYDSLLVAHLAGELDARLRGSRAFAVRLDPDARRASIELDGTALLFDLHPLRGWILEGAPAPAPDIRRLHRSARVGRVRAPLDERLLRIELDGSTSETRPIRGLIVELLTNQHNVIAVDADDRIVALLRPRSAGGRELRPGRRYRPPPPEDRAGASEAIPEDAWTDRWGAGAVKNVAWVSPLNVGSIGSYEDWRRLAHGPPQPALIRRDDGAWQPYPHPLGADSRPAASLLDGMRACAGAEAAPAADAAASPELLDRVRREITRVEARIERLEAQGRRALPEAAALRARGDLLLARLQEVPRGASSVTLEGFDGATVDIELDPSRNGADNARALYDRARRRERAADRVPALVAAERKRLGALGSALRRAEEGEADAEALESLLPTVRPERGGGADDERLPFRSYRTSGGLEVRVGRSGRANDALTFHHSRPDDIWLHARDAAGAHVILRWSDAQAGPPQRDLAEAAVLAAVHSRARTSGTVPVDWTRRKYVRKPRKAPPGAVLPERVKTVFVEPSEELERSLRA